MDIIVGISGASGAIMAVRLLEALKKAGAMTHLVMTESARLTLNYETEITAEEVESLADFSYAENDMAAAIASGSVRTAGMVVLPCSMKTLAGIVSGYADNLLLRAADVCLKEGRKLVICPRETPLSKVHLRNLLSAADLGITVLPPMLTFYSHNDTVEKQIDHIIGKIFMQFGLDYEKFVPWHSEKN